MKFIVSYGDALDVPDDAPYGYGSHRKGPRHEDGRMGLYGTSRSMLAGENVYGKKIDTCKDACVRCDKRQETGDFAKFPMIVKLTMILPISR